MEKEKFPVAMFETDNKGVLLILFSYYRPNEQILHTEIKCCRRSQPCINGGTCAADGTGYRCTCPAGLVGVHCEMNNNECESRPCENGATCVDLLDSFFCVCAQGYSGRDCNVIEVR